jgi:hypothetical protein
VPAPGPGPGLAPARAPGINDTAIISDDFCAAINSIDANNNSVDPTSNQSRITTLINELKGKFTNNENQILVGITSNQAIYQGQFLAVAQKLCNVYSKIKKINSMLPKTAADIVVGNVGTCSFDQAGTQATISISISPNSSASDTNYGKWTINGILPSGPPGDLGPTGRQGAQGDTGSIGPPGDRGIRGDWSQKPNPIPDNTQAALGYFNAGTNMFGSIY